MDYGIILNIGIFAAILVLLIVTITGKINESKKYGELNRKVASLENKAEYIEKSAEKLEQLLREEMGRNRLESSGSINSLSDSLTLRINEMTKLQQMQSDSIDKRMTALTESNENRLESVRITVEENLKEIRKDNSEKLEAMRATVEEKLHDTLEKRLGESFKIVSDRLEQVHRGLGEMQTLASGVGDLKKVLSNVKTRGIWGEIQLENVLEQVLSPEQYATNVKIKENSLENVEFAIRLPGKDGNAAEILLPIDAKFPLEGFQRLIDASEQGDVIAVQEASKQLENSIKIEAKRICGKYINPPYTTDFAIMFLPIESLYAEVVKSPGLLEHLQEKHRIIVSGPSTIVAFLNSLSMGFRTLAIEKRSGEIWNLLGVVKREFTNFGNLLETTNKKLQEASNVIDKATKKTRTIEKKLRDVEELPEAQNNFERIDGTS